MKLSKAVSEISEAVFPSGIYCIVCGSLIDRSRMYGLCDECIRKLHWINGRTCGKCGKALPDEYLGELCYDCMELEHFFTRGFSCLTYGFYERQIMMDIKYHGKGYMAVKMGDVLFDRMETLIMAAAKKGIKPFDVVIPVPVSESRRRKRGYNQAELMTAQFIKRWKSVDRDGWPLHERNVLERRHETEMLRSMNPSERRLALKDAFEVKSHKADRVRAKAVLLVDDIYTTGATADACSKALIEAGAEAVYLLTLCSGGNRKPEELEKLRD
ncbi:MAG: double zinc ribbon domain-containing protein [Clostridia bacterium]|nr:double zinc ribbon domain-containing protein [Clostridia bacterium]